MLVSFVVPCYNEEESLPIFYKEACHVSDILRKEYQAEAEFIFIDDGSSDGTVKELRKLRKKDDRVRFISFSRNFGKEAGLYAGLKNAEGDYVATLDADLQDPPSLMPEMLRFLTENKEYDCVATRRETRKGEPLVRSLFAKLFYKIINKLSGTEIMDGARDFRFMTRKFVDAILDLTFPKEFSLGLDSRLIGFPIRI